MKSQPTLRVLVAMLAIGTVCSAGSSGRAGPKPASEGSLTVAPSDPAAQSDAAAPAAEPSHGVAPTDGVAPAGRAIAMSPQADRKPTPKLDLDASRAVRRGLDYLRSTQNDDGSWTDKIGRKVHYDYRGSLGKHVGVTALACMAFLANGSLPGRGEYAEQIERGLDFILKNVQHNGFITNAESRMYSHAFATLFLAEVYGMTGMDSVGRKLKQSISLIVEAQNPSGGWRYQPGAPDADMSITVCQVMALRAANNAGISVPKIVIDRAIDYVKNSYNHRYGAFNYQIEEGPNGRRQMSRHSFALTAAGVTALYGAGVYDDAHLESGLRFLRQQIHSWSRGAESRFDYYYGMYYGTQAAFQRGGEYWDFWHEKVWRDLLRSQHRNGYWRDLVGRNYATAMACVILQIPYQYLPIFER